MNVVMFERDDVLVWRWGLVVEDVQRGGEPVLLFLVFSFGHELDDAGLDCPCQRNVTPQIIAIIRFDLSQFLK
jgi:hypothetical protein